MSEELYHFGIKGMKWGVRRYQNPDGTLTAAGKKQYAKKADLAKKLSGYANRYNSYSKKFLDAADTLEREGTRGKSKYMRRLNETDWSSVYDHGASHRKALDDVVKILRRESVTASNYSKVYRDGAEYLTKNKDVMGVSFKEARKLLNENIYAKARSRYGLDDVDDWSYIIDDYYYD